MKPRKIVLLCACTILLVIAICQAVMAGKDPVKVVSVKGEIDEVRITRNGNELLLKKSGDDWLVGAKGYLGNENVCLSVVESIAQVKLLDKVGHGDSESLLSKYDLSEEKAIVVKAYAGGSEKRTLYVGKASSTGTQCYVMLDSSKDIYLANSDLSSDFGKTLSELRSRAALQLPKDDLTSVKVDYLNGEAWTMSREGDGNIFKITGGNSVDVDEEKALSWFEGAASLMANMWCDDGAKPQGEKILKVSYTLGTREVNLDIWQAQDADGDAEYYGRTSENDYLFKLAQYSVQKYQKHPEDFGK